MKKTGIPAFLIIIILMLITIKISTVNSVALLLLMSIDKQEYNIGENIYVSGNLTFDGSPVEDALIALQVTGPTGTVVIRTLNTGRNPTLQLKVETLSVYSSDEYGNPKNSQVRGKSAYFTTITRNNDVVSHVARITVNIYDANNATLGVASTQTLIPAQQEIPITHPVPIPDTASIGNAKVFGNAYTDWPQDGGTPYSPEKYGSFQITSGAASSTSMTISAVYPQSASGAFSLTFTTISGAGLGTYTICTTTSYLGLYADTNETFQVILVGDTNGDKYVNIKDIVIVGVAFGTQPGDSNWDSRADINKDKFVNIKDMVLASSNFGKYGI
jgi:hypothetical protein